MTLPYRISTAEGHLMSGSKSPCRSLVEHTDGEILAGAMSVAGAKSEAHHDY